MKLRINYIFSVIVLLFSKEGLKQPAKAVSLLKLEPKVSSFPEAGQKVSKIEESTIKF